MRKSIIVLRWKETVNVHAITKLSKQQKRILTILEEHNGEINQRKLTRIIAEETGKFRHISKHDRTEHAIKTLRQADDDRERRLLELLLTDSIRNMPRRGYHHVTESGRASMCRSLRRLEKRGLVYRDVWEHVYLAHKFPERYKNDMLTKRRIMWKIRAKKESRQTWQIIPTFFQ